MISSLLILAAAAAGQTTDPLAPAREGKVQCVVPNQEKKVCSGITSYKVAADGSYESTSKLFLNPNPPPLITMEVHTRGGVKDGRICETIHAADFQAGTVFVDGAAADEATSGAVKAQFAAVIAPLDGKMACSEIKPADGGLLLNEVTIDGVVRSDLSQKFIWVGEKDGFALGA